jgi:hypothetical protein
MRFVAVNENESAGALVFWSMSGEVSRDELIECLDLCNVSLDCVPPVPSTKLFATRAAARACTGPRQFVRPLKKRLAWVVVTEVVVSHPDEEDRIDLRHNVRVTVPDDFAVQVVPVTLDDEPLAMSVRDWCQHYKNVLVPMDISYWLLGLLGQEFDAISLRERGGMYFVPNAHLSTWRKLVQALRMCSAHKVYEIPAMRTEEAVEAILDAVRREMHAKFQEFEEYLLGETSTRGLNVWERELANASAKAEKYAALLGVALPDLTQRAETLQGALQGARLLNTKAPK